MKNKLNISPAAQALKDLIDEEAASRGGDDIPDEVDSPDDLSPHEAEAIRQMMQNRLDGNELPVDMQGNFGAPSINLPQKEEQKIDNNLPKSDNNLPKSDIKFKLIPGKQNKESQYSNPYGLDPWYKNYKRKPKK